MKRPNEASAERGFDLFKDAAEVLHNLGSAGDDAQWQLTQQRVADANPRVSRVQQLTGFSPFSSAEAALTLSSSAVGVEKSFSPLSSAEVALTYDGAHNDSSAVSIRSATRRRL